MECDKTFKSLKEICKHYHKEHDYCHCCGNCKRCGVKNPNHVESYMERS